VIHIHELPDTLDLSCLQCVTRLPREITNPGQQLADELWLAVPHASHLRHHLRGRRPVGRTTYGEVEGRDVERRGFRLILSEKTNAPVLGCELIDA
jgi:hypothetical protein